MLPVNPKLAIWSDEKPEIAKISFSYLRSKKLITENTLSIKCLEKLMYYSCNNNVASVKTKNLRQTRSQTKFYYLWSIMAGSPTITTLYDSKKLVIQL